PKSTPCGRSCLRTNDHDAFPGFHPERDGARCHRLARCSRLGCHTTPPRSTGSWHHARPRVGRRRGHHHVVFLSHRDARLTTCPAHGGHLWLLGFDHLHRAH